MFIGDDGVGVEFVERGVSVLHDVFEFVDVAYSDWLIEGNAGEFFFEIFDVYFLVGD